MIVKQIKLKNFQCYSDFKVNFSTFNFLKGENGSGKTTLGLDAILFALFGYCRKTLADLPNRINKNKSCWVEIELEHKGNNFAIVRKYPTNLIIFRNSNEIKFVSSMEAQRYLNKIFGDVNTFKRFRMIDDSIGINFLAEGQIALKKIIFSMTQDVFNNIRDRLSKIKHEREIYNRDKLQTETHYPSQKRLDCLIKNKLDLDKEINTVGHGVRDLDSELNDYSRQQGKLENEKETIKEERDILLTNQYCYACKQQLPQENKSKMLKQKGERLVQINASLTNILETSKEIEEIAIQKHGALKRLEIKEDKIQKLIYKLETRIKQKDYKYTTKDIEIVKKAIKELDNLSSCYLTNHIKTLEPIINSVLENIHFSVKFELNEKGKFAIKLRKDNIEYDYKDLSAGERLILQIAFKLALLLEKNEEGLIIADEGLSNLDKENLLHILTIFENYPFQLIFMLHNFDEIPKQIKVINLNKE